MGKFSIPRDPDRSIEFSRTEFRPPPDMCSCDSCQDLRGNRLLGPVAAVTEARRELRDSTNPDCEYVNYERVFSDLWKTREASPWRQSTLAALMWQPEARGGFHAYALTGRDRRIAATVIQWLGTNCGLAFLHEALGACGMYIGYSNRGRGVEGVTRLVRADILDILSRTTTNAREEDDGEEEETGDREGAEG